MDPKDWKRDTKAKGAVLDDGDELQGRWSEHLAPGDDDGGEGCALPRWEQGLPPINQCGEGEEGNGH